MTQKQIILKVEGHDPIAQQLMKYGLTPIKFGILVLLLNIFVDSILGVTFGVFLSNGENPGILQDLTAMSFDFFITPLICGAYLWSALASDKLLNDIQEKGIIKSIKNANDSINEINIQYRRYHFLFLAILFSSIFATAQVAAYMGWVPWRTFSGYLYIYPPMSFARMPFWFFTFYSIAYSIFNISITSSILGSIFKRPNNININLLHPDKCGGLSIMGNYASKTGYVIIPIGLFASVSAILEIQQGNFSTAYPIHLFILVYILLAPIVFALPVWEAHKAMSTKKCAELLKISDRFQNKYAKILTSSTLIWKQSDLEDTQKLHQFVSEKYPNWPFNLGNLQRFVFTIISPLIPIAISILTDVLLKALI